ncbi:MAG: phenylalanine-4-hydroxylase [Deltaproteobacteria bacterium]|nr:phenylalanine-4-hydroxylase [Deltaproteobacteria bacterium]
MELRAFGPAEHETWSLLFDGQAPLRDQQIVSHFGEGLEALGMDRARIPTLSDVNARLRERTGFRGVPVAGLEEHEAFFRLLADRCFPIGNFIRDRRDLSYTPAPDVFHDLYGHVPFLANRDYADFCAAFGALAGQLATTPEKVTRLARFFWFTIEFALVQTQHGRRIFGAGIASSKKECAFALSDEPEVRPFSVQAVCDQDFRIDKLQNVLFELRAPEQLYASLPALERIVRAVN